MIPPDVEPSLLGADVRVYRNLTRKCWSVQTKTKKGWRVTAHADHLYLADVTFHVSNAGRERVLRTNRKNVHAWAEGWVTATLPWTTPPGVTVSYNPRKSATFCAVDHYAMQTNRYYPVVLGAANVHFRTNGDAIIALPGMKYPTIPPLYEPTEAVA